MKKLYLCDGHACDESSKIICYTIGGDCVHTSHIEHSLSKNNKDFPSTIFMPFGTDKILVEEFDERGIFAEMRKGKRLKLIESE